MATRKSVVLVLLLAAALMITVGCSNPIEDVSPQGWDNEGDKVSIYNGDSPANGVYSYQANVQTFYSNNRTGIMMDPVDEFRLSMRIIDGEVYSRIDFEAYAFPDGMARTVVSNSTEMV
ncbi:MAG: hypothetical protein ACOC0D_07880, partial [Spirochaeta sp.]